MLKLFTQHPASVNQSYFSHLRFALIFGFQMIYGGIACMIHAIFPFLFQNTGSQTVIRLMQKYLIQHEMHNNQYERCMLNDLLMRKKVIENNKCAHKN
ncbi:MAG TPA: DUF6356 family protein [Legionella sp.]|nr:DUF6356 family protein [Legionella sp.]